MQNVKRQSGIRSERFVSIVTAKVTILFDMKPKININYILGSCVIVMLVLCLLCVWQPMSFDRVRAEREKTVRQRIAQIMSAEERYRKQHGVYTGSLDSLVQGRWIADSLQYIPYSDKKKFHLAATINVERNGQQTSLVECGATFEDYLYGMDADAVSQLTEQATYAGEYPGLKSGDISKGNNDKANR